MDEAKSIRFKTRQRISSLPDGTREISASFVKFRNNSFDTKIPKHLSADARRRHTIHVPYTGSSSQDFTDAFKFCINPGAESYIEPRVEGISIKGGDNAVEPARNTQFPLLKEVQVTLEPTAGKKIKRLQRLHSYNDESEGTIQTSLQGWAYVTSGTNHASPQNLSAKSTFPVIKNNLRDCRRNSLPVSAEHMEDLFPLSFSSASGILEEASVGHTKASRANSLPQVTQAKLANLKIDQPENAGYNLAETENHRKSTAWQADTGYHCFRANQTRSCTESNTKNACESDKAHAIRTYVEEADACFDKEKATAVRLFEWLQDQTE